MFAIIPSLERATKHYIGGMETVLRIQIQRIWVTEKSRIRKKNGSYKI